MNIKIAEKNIIIGDKHPVFIVAELSANHLKDFNLAVKTIKAMKKSGADAVKLQTYTPDTITINCNNKYFWIKNSSLWKGKTLYQLYDEAYTPWEWQPKLKKIAEDSGLVCFSTPFDRTAVDFLETMDVSLYKVASFEITDVPLIEYIAKKKKPVIISTGMATFADIKEALNACRRMNNQKVILLKCTSEYPTNFEEVNLRTIPDLAKKFKAVIGISDHTLGISVPIASIALGAKVIEKHFILDKNLGGPDASFSLEPDEFKRMVDSIRETEKALGDVDYKIPNSVKKNRIFLRSLFAVEDIGKDEKITKENVKSIRPGYGLHPKYLGKIIGKKAKRIIKRGTPVRMEYIK